MSKMQNTLLRMAQMTWKTVVVTGLAKVALTGTITLAQGVAIAVALILSVSLLIAARKGR